MRLYYVYYQRIIRPKNILEKHGMYALKSKAKSEKTRIITAQQPELSVEPITGAAPVVEIFDNRIEVTNPGTPLVDVLRIIDNPPNSRNEKLASLMRRLKMCEELGRGWDRMVLACEAQYLPAPRIEVFQDSTKVTLFSEMEFSNIPMEDKLWSCYLHACLMYIQGDALTNKSLRDRFGIPETSSSSSSRLIKEAIGKNLIKVLDPNTAPRYMKYIPIWA